MKTCAVQLRRKKEVVPGGGPLTHLKVKDAQVVFIVGLFLTQPPDGAVEQES